MRRVAPPSGQEPPHEVRRKDGSPLALDPLARELCDAYFAEYPDHVEHYGDAGDAWCVHDSLYLFAWAIGDCDWGDVELVDQARWLSGILTARDFPLERFVRHLELAAAVARNRGDKAVGARLATAAAQVARQDRD